MQIRNSNSHGLAALVRGNGGEPRVRAQIIPRLLVPASLFVGGKRAYQGLRRLRPARTSGAPQ